MKFIAEIFWFWRHKYKYYKKLGLKFWESYGWWNRLFHARDAKPWVEKKVSSEEAWWARLFNIKPEDWKPLGKKKIALAMAFPIAPDGIEHRYSGVKRTNDYAIGKPEYVGKMPPSEEIPVFDADLEELIEEKDE